MGFNVLSIYRLFVLSKLFQHQHSLNVGVYVAIFIFLLFSFLYHLYLSPFHNMAVLEVKNSRSLKGFSSLKKAQVGFAVISWNVSVVLSRANTTKIQ